MMKTKSDFQQEQERKRKKKWYTSWISYVCVIITMVILVVTCDWKIL
jgi:hypothetical protein